MSPQLGRLNHPYVRYGAVGLVVLLSLHLLLSVSSSTYSSGTEAARAKLGLGHDGSEAQTWADGRVLKSPTTWRPTVEDDSPVNGTRANAAFVVLARNSDVWEILSSIRGMEGELAAFGYCGTAGVGARCFSALTHCSSSSRPLQSQVQLPMGLSQ